MKLHNRELSWLSFNARVLQEAEDPSVPLLERLRFLGIFSSNLDEFFRVRVATLRRMTALGSKAKKIIGDHPKQILARIYENVVDQQRKFESIYAGLIDELEVHNVYIVDETEITEEQGRFVSDYFHREVRPALVPVMIDSVDEFPYLKDRAIYLTVLLVDSTGKHKPRYALIEIPTDVVPRFVVLPETNGKKFVMLLDDMIRFALRDIFYIFPHDTHQAYTIKMTRDAELDIENDLTESLVEKIQKSVKQRSYGKPVRIVYDEAMQPDLLKYMLRRIQLHDKKENLIPAGRYHNFRDFMKFPVLGLSALTYPQRRPLPHPAFPANTSMMARMQQGDVLLHFPYHTFDYVIDLLREAAIDPRVESIKMTLYRLAPKSMIGNALINAANNGKKVTVVMELQARFDEENNILWSDKLSEEGVTVITGVPGLKVHSKVCLITRKEKGRRVQYANFGTGNYNEITARLYADHSLFTCDKRITDELEGLFNFLESSYKVVPFKHLLTAPFQMRKKFLRFIDDEISHAAHGKPAA
ncbi:MAG TPA: polyphosphate kinase 1, partial [Chitinophagales bacterium]|nr:polyphosphate kinase 1 [Chitinophagales bacterium]